MLRSRDYSCFFFNDTATTEIYTLSLHDALPISSRRRHTRSDRDWSSDVCSSDRSEEHTSELQSRSDLVCRLLLVTGVQTCALPIDRKSTRLNSSHDQISHAVFCLKKKNDFADRPVLRARLPVRLALSEPFPFPEDRGTHGLELLPQRLHRLRQTHRGTPSTRVIDVARSIPHGGLTAARARASARAPQWGRLVRGRSRPFDELASASGRRERRRLPRRPSRRPHGQNDLVGRRALGIGVEDADPDAREVAAQPLESRALLPDPLRLGTDDEARLQRPVPGVVRRLAARRDPDLDVP